MSTYLQFEFTEVSAAQKDILIAHLSAIGFEGFEEERTALKAFVSANAFDESSFEQYLQANQLTCNKVVIEEKNWNEEWETNFEPVVVNNFCAIRAGFHSPMPLLQHEIIITPKMSFGTGHHATTYMMVQAMQALDFSGRMVFDFGTGTGVLAILAEKMGAAAITAVDNDDWSIANAAENIQNNNCHNITLYSSAYMPQQQLFDVILANINKNVILQHMAAMRQHLATGGVLLLSGLLQGDEEDVMAAATAQGFVNTGMLERNSWICLKLMAKDPADGVEK